MPRFKLFIQVMLSTTLVIVSSFKTGNLRESHQARKDKTRNMAIESPWHGFVELGQTHVIEGTGEIRHAPRIIAEREAELLFTPTIEAPPTLSPTSAPTKSIGHIWGLEQLSDLPLVEFSPNSNYTTWPDSYPRDPSDIINDHSSEYYIPNERPDIDMTFDLQAQRLIQGVKIKAWFTTRIVEIRVGVKSDDGADIEDSLEFTEKAEGIWTWYDSYEISSGYNTERIVLIPKVSARYITIQLRGGSSDNNSRWGLRHILISGELDGLLDNAGAESNNVTETLDGIAFFPAPDANVWVKAYSTDGSLLGVQKARNPNLIRPLLEQSITNKDLDPYSNYAWSATLPWNWVVQGTEVTIHVDDPENSSSILVHRLILSNIVSWSQHTLSRTKVAIFGDSSDLDKLDTTTHLASRIAVGMFGSMPVSELRWVDTETWHLPHLVVRTSLGPQLVTNEQERRDTFLAAGDDPGTEPGWEILKNQLTLRHSLANTGRGLGLTTIGASSSPYSSGTSIFMGWALSSPDNDGKWNWDKLGYWGWGAAGWTGWTSMRPGDECGNTLIHELGHSQTMSHFTDGTALKWGITDEYPEDGTNLKHHPWGYDTVSRRFRTLYDHANDSGKRDPMNGGEPANSETCFPQYTAYHAKKSQNWAFGNPLLLSSEVSGVDTDGVYLFSEENHKYELYTGGKYIQESDQVDVPIVTLVGTLGGNDNVCQIYPGVRSNAGNTFMFPEPFGSELESQVWYSAAYAIEITLVDGTEWALISSQKILENSTSMSMFSFNIALSRHPISVKLFRFDDESYPNLTLQSNKTLLYTRKIYSLESSISELPKVVRVGRGWLGYAEDSIIISKVCISKEDCKSEATTQEIMKWRGAEGAQLTYSASISVMKDKSTTDASAFLLPVVREEDESIHYVTVLASSFFYENGKIKYFPLIEDPSSRISDIGKNPDDTHGIHMCAPFELNSHLDSGAYFSSKGSFEIWSENPSGDRFSNIIPSMQFQILKASEVVDLSDNAQYISKNQFFAPDSSAYFIVDDPTIGPTSPVWWGGDRETLSVPLYSSCLNDSNAVVASVKAQQKACNSVWQMNAGKSANECGHSLVLKLDDATLNPWLNQDEYQGCEFKTHPIRPILFNALRWHNPNSNTKIGSEVLDIIVTIPMSPTDSPSSTPTLSLSNLPSISSFPTNIPSIAPSKVPTNSPTISPTNLSSGLPTISPSNTPSVTPTNSPTKAASIVDLSNNYKYESSEEFFAPASSAYFLAVDPAVGPTSRVWWGSDRATLSVPLVSSCLDIGMELFASVKAQQKSCNSVWQMDAGRSANECGHSLVLQLDDVTLNPWLDEVEFQGCTFESKDTLIFTAHRWHSPDAKAELGTLRLDLSIIITGETSGLRI